MFSLPIYIAKRYLFSKKSVNAINIISGISMVGVLVGSASLIIILSVFNGLEEMIMKMYGNLAPQLRIEAIEGKSFSVDSVNLSQLETTPGVESYSKVLEEKVLLKYGKNQFIGVLKGTSMRIEELPERDSLMSQGSFAFDPDSSEVVVGSAVAAYLGIDITDNQQVLEIYSPKRQVRASINPADEFRVSYVHPVGVLQRQPQVDEFVYAPLLTARAALGIENRISAIEVELQPGVSERAFKTKIEAQLGPSFTVKDRGEQNPMLYKILNSEKWAIFLILMFVLAIAILNIIGSLTMLVVDKKQDIAVLRSLGASPGLIKNIFFTEGMIISLIGCIAGMAVGLTFCLIQINFGIISMEGNNLISEVYPVSLRGSDFLLVFLTVSVISAISAFVSSRISLKGQEKLS